MSLINKKQFFCILAGSIAFIVYLLSVCHAIYPGDSPEFITAAYTLGIAHPPGYPIYCLLGKIFTFLPVGSIALRVNLLSCFFGALTIVLLYLVILKVTDNVFLSFCFSLAGAFSKIFWSQAVIAEVYALNAFFLFITFYVLLLWDETKEDSYIFLLTFFLGLGLANHYILCLAVPAYLLFVLWAWHEERESEISHEHNYNKMKPPRAHSRGLLRRRIKLVFTMAVLFILGISVYFYLIIRSAANPPIDWGNPENPASFMKHILRVQYRAFEASEKVSLATKLLFTRDFFTKVITQFPLLIWLMGIPGIYWLLRRKIKILFVSLAIFILNGFSVILLLQFRYNPTSTGIVEVYYLPAYLLSAFWIACGFKYIIEKTGAGTAVKYIINGLAVFVPLLLVSNNFYENNLSRHYFMNDYGMNMLVNLQNDSFLNLGADDGIVFPMLYLKHVEKLRSDIKMKDSAGLLFNDAFTDKPGQAVYYAEVIDDNKDREPMGFVYKTVKKNEEFSSSPLWMDNYIKRGLEDNTVFKDYWTRGITARYPLALAIFHFRKGNQEAGIKQLEKAFSIASDIPWLVKNIGFIYYSEGLFEYAARVYKRLIEIDRSDITAYKSLASCYEKMGMQNEPVNVYKACQKVVPTAEVASILAALYEKQGNDDEAIKNYKTAISRKTDYFEAYNNLGAIYKKKGNTEEAVKQFSRAIKINPSYVEARYNLAMSYMEIDYKKAINEFNEVLRIMPDFMDVHYNLGVLYGKTGQVEKAIEEYEEELKINPSSASACKNLGIFYHDAGQNKKTVYYWKKYLQLNPSAPDAALIEAEIYKME